MIYDEDESQPAPRYYYVRLIVIHAVCCCMIYYRGREVTRRTQSFLPHSKPPKTEGILNQFSMIYTVLLLFYGIIGRCHVLSWCCIFSSLRVYLSFSYLSSTSFIFPVCVVACDHGGCVSPGESISTKFGCTRWLSQSKKSCFIM